MIGIISDVHGNLPALRAVLKRLDELGCERAISLGDVAGYYPFINECCALIRKRNIISLYGNHDHYLVSGADCPRSVSASLCLAYQRKVVSPENLDWLARSPRRMTLGACSLLHGGWMDEIEEYIYEPTAAYFCPLPGDLFISGHTHVQGRWNFGSKTYCNPGSVGQPRDGNWEAAFATLVDKDVILHRVPYDVEETINRMRELEFPEAFSSNLRNGTRIAGKIC